MKGYAICPECKGVMIVQRTDPATAWRGVHCDFVRYFTSSNVLLESTAEDLSEKEIKEALEFFGE